MKVAINGLGRIGKSILSYLIESRSINLELINDLNEDLNNICYLINYDSTYGNNKVNAKILKKNLLKIGNNKIRYTSKKNISDLNLKDIDVLIECTGREWTNNALKKLKTKVKHVIFTNIPKSLNYGYFLNDINTHKLTKKNFIISSGTCDGNAVVPILKVLQNLSEIENGNITTLHPWLSYQNLIDGHLKSVSDPKNIYSTYVLGRSSINNIIPKTTSVVNVASKIYQNIEKKITCMSYRVPTSIVSCAEFNISLKNKVSINKIKKELYEFEKNQSSKIMKNFNFPLTSLDLKGSPYSSNIDHRWTHANSKQVRLVTWYDNEMGYASRVIDLLNKIKIII